MLDHLIKKILTKNLKLKNKYKNQTCYILGNGASLKNYDLKFLKDENIITCNWMLLHEDFKHLKKIIGYVELTPFYFFPFLRNPYTRKMEINYVKKIFNENYKNFDFPLFASVTNLFFLDRNKTFFLHDFRDKKINFNNYKIDQKFPLMKGAFYSMLGIAKYMGFNKIYLVGLDYWMSEPITGHFYEKKIYDVENNNYLKTVKHKVDFPFINQVNKELDVTMICPKKYSSNLFKSINYSKFFQTNENIKRNDEIVSMKNLQALSKLSWKLEIF